MRLRDGRSHTRRCGSNLPGFGETRAGYRYTGTITHIDVKKGIVQVKKDEKTLTLRVHAERPNKVKLQKQVAKLKVGQALKATYYVKDAKTYLCQIADKTKDGPSCH